MEVGQFFARSSPCLPSCREKVMLGLLESAKCSLCAVLGCLSKGKLLVRKGTALKALMIIRRARYVR